MNDGVVREKVKAFVKDWKEAGSEKAEDQKFWIDLIQALGCKNATKILQFQVPVTVNNHKCYIDAWINTTKVLIEHKSRGIDLDKPAKQSDGSFLTPFQQAKRYADNRDYSQKPRWIVTCNFTQIRVYDMDLYQKQNAQYLPNIIDVRRLPHEYHRLNFLIDPNDENVNPAVAVSKKAIEHIKNIYSALKKINRDADTLNEFCVRLMFCLYADDADIFEPKQFANYLKSAGDRRQALADIFDTLDTPKDRRNPNLPAALNAFKYVDGDLFRAAASQIPNINAAVCSYIFRTTDFDWLDISPPHFGAMFESILNPQTRRTGGMHYTETDNIHKVIDPLFLNALHKEFKDIKRLQKRKRLTELNAFQAKLAALKFLDPACGSGNFLTETYISIRSLENQVLDELHDLGAPCDILVSIENFYGIEINDFAVAVARTALWIAENQMMSKTERLIHQKFEFLPLKSAAHIVCGNALTLDWNVVAPTGVDFIIGNPPFSGRRYQTVEQRADIERFFNYKDVDYVACWFKKAAEFMSKASAIVRAAFVATNSIVQGEQVSAVWKDILTAVHIDFARRTFRWWSDSDDPAAVYCVVIGFSAAPNDDQRIIFDGNNEIAAENINAYLIDAPNIVISNRTVPLCPAPQMSDGNVPLDGDALKIEAADYDEFIEKEPRAKQFIKRLVGGRELLYSEARYVLWLVDVSMEVIQSMPLVAERVERCRQKRLAMKDAGTRRLAERPTTFRGTLNPERYIALPRVSSGLRRYVPMNYFDGETIPTNQVLIIPNAALFHFSVLMSSVHMAWLRTTAGYLGTSYRYSKDVVYNNFVWPELTEAQRSLLCESARSILLARGMYPDWTLAGLYDESSMPPELRRAHVANDELVQSMYGFSDALTEGEIVSRLMSLYSARAADTKNY